MKKSLAEFFISLSNLILVFINGKLISHKSNFVNTSVHVGLRLNCVKHISFTTVFNSVQLIFNSGLFDILFSDLKWRKNFKRCFLEKYCSRINVEIKEFLYDFTQTKGIGFCRVMSFPEITRNFRSYKTKSTHSFRV